MKPAYRLLRICISCFILMAIFLVNPASADSVTLQAMKDNTLYEQASGNLSNGAGDHFFCGTTAAEDIRRGLIAFDISGNVPAGVNIDSVRLTLYMSRSISGNQSVNLHRVTADWGEGTSDAPGGEGGGAPATSGDATWLHTFYSTDFWANAGGDYTGTVSAIQTVDGIGSYSWGTSQMGGDVQSWLDSPSGNFGWILIGNESGAGTSKRFDTRENATPANRPTLTVYYSSTGTFVKDIMPDWNLLGLPLNVSDPFYLSLFPDAISGTLFGFNGSYTPEDTLLAGTGYWLRFPNAGSRSISGSPINSLNLQLQTGWNLITGISCDIPLSSVQDPTGILIPGTLFSFNGSYVPADTLRQGEGYWIRASGPGPVTLDCN
ncbi:MAG: DNRLRE domain-containing protein [Calditrichia bacterium]